MAESPKKEGLIYVGTDDGLVQVTEDGGKHWTKIDKPAGVPRMPTCSASWHRSTTLVRFTWRTRITRTAISSRISSRAATPARPGSISPAPARARGVYAIAEDPVNKNLIFAGTEFGLYFTNIGGEKWIKLNVGLPTIMVRDLVIQKQMDDLVIGTFAAALRAGRL